jgi:LuxR family transcriptional regulator, maltose regulon positive regulatory protein
MAERLAAAPAGTVAAERDVLLATKLHMPVPRPGLVLRSRLAGQLDHGRARGVILACAPAGYGKTVLVADWARRTGDPVAWLSLDAGDNDPARLWRHVVAALDRAVPGIADQVAPLLVPLLGPLAPGSFEGLVTALINELAAEPAADHALLILDDYHAITAPPVHELLGFLVEHRPAGLCVVLVSRSDPPLPLARLRGRGQLGEVRAAELRFTDAEAAVLLQHVAAASGPVLSAEAVAALAERTEGWAAGLQLAALSLRGQDDVAGFVAAFTGSHRYVLDYLTEEVLEQQDEQVRAFLLDTSVLDRLSGPLCDAVTGRTGSQALLDRVERAGLFLVPLDEVRGWWRYHHLFADLLRARLRQEQPDRAAQLHHRAATWCAEHGLADDAVQHATAAGEMLWAARLIERHFDETYYGGGEVATIRRWVSGLPADLIRIRPRLLLAQALLAGMSGPPEAVKLLLDAAERAGARAAAEPFEPTVGVADSMLANVAARTALFRASLASFSGDIEAMGTYIAQGLAAVGERERLLSSVGQLHLGVAEWLNGRLAQAERTLLATSTAWREAGQASVTAWSCYLLGQVQYAQGHLNTAVQTHRQALESAEAAACPRAAAGPAHVGLAQVAYQRNEMDAALQSVTEGISLCRRFVYTVPLAAGLATLAWIRQASGDPSAARQAMLEAERSVPGSAGLLNPVSAQRARLLLVQGNVAEAAQWVDDLGLNGKDEPDYPREPAYLIVARVLLAQDRPGLALALLDRLQAAAAAQGRTGSLIETGTLRALALAASGRETAAVAALARTLTLSCPHGHVRVFADEGPPMAALLSQLMAVHRAGQAAMDVSPGYLTRLQHAMDGRAPAPPTGRHTAPMPGLIDPLTNREMEVLRMMAAGRSNPAIAGELVVTLNTVKKHVGHVLGKLGAANRTEAVARARQLALISLPVRPTAGAVGRDAAFP